MRSFASAALWVSVLAALSCRAQVQGDASANLSGARASGDAELDAELQRERAEQPELMSSESSGAGEPALLGARRDLTLVPASAPIQCKCLKVALGTTSHPAFRWAEGPPTIDETRQLVVGVTSDGVGCEHPEGSLGGSYWGYKSSGSDIVVYVESLVKGRPLATGAVIPKPVGDGQVFAAPAFKRDPYGRGLGGEARCKLGNVGPARGEPLSPDEAGGPAP